MHQWYQHFNRARLEYTPPFQANLITNITEENTVYHIFCNLYPSWVKITFDFIPYVDYVIV